MAFLTVAELITSVRNRMNIEDPDQFVTDTEILDLLNGHWEALWHEVVETNAEFLSVTVTYDGTLGSTGPVPTNGRLPLDGFDSGDAGLNYTVWRHLGIWIELTSGSSPDLRRLHRVEWNERERLGYERQSYTATPIRYALFDQELWMLPKPDRTYNYRWTFIPVCQRLVNDETEYNFYMGWQNFLIYGTCADICEKEERDPSYFLLKMNEWKQRIMTQASPRDEGEPPTAHTDTRDEFDAYLDAV